MKSPSTSSGRLVSIRKLHNPVHHTIPKPTFTFPFFSMKKSKSFRPILHLSLLAGCIGLAHAAPYGPNGRETRWEQPNGQVVQLRVFGDEFYARTENADGYTVVLENGSYAYARLSADGSRLESSGIQADQPAPDGLAKHLALPKDEIRKVALTNFTKFNNANDKRWEKRVDAQRKIRMAAAGANLGKSEMEAAKIDAAPIEGNQLGLTILVQFPNDPNTGGADPINFPSDRAKIQRFCNQTNYTENGNTGSVRDYFFDQSLGKLTYTQKVTPIVTLPNPRNFYNYSDYPNNRNLQDPQVAGSQIISDAVAILKSQNFDFSGLTVNANNQAVATNVFFAGPDSGSWAQGLWPHASTVIPGISVGAGSQPITLSSYQMTNLENNAPVIGTFCHENGHLLLDYPDLYDVIGEGVGEHCLMGSGNYLNDGKTPCPINVHFKDLVGWATITSLNPNAYRTVDLPTTGNIGYRVMNPSAQTEFFMVENRGAGDKWAKFCDDKGIAIWHVDENVDGNLGGAHYGVALMQADGREDLENGRNRGDSADLFDSITSKFTDNTNPSANWWDDSRSNVEIQVLSNIGQKTTVSFGGVPPNTIILSSPNGGEVIYRDGIFPVTWQANIIGNVRIDLYKGGKFLKTLTQDHANNGNFDWNVSSDLKPASDYSIRISSVGNPVQAIDTSNANFTITNATFPEGGEIPYGWFKPKKADSKWKVTKQTKFEGKAALASIKPNDGTFNAIAYTSDFQKGVLGFYIKTSTEKGFDYARFYIDGKPQDFLGIATSKGISGVLDWTYVQFPVSAGKHTFMWTYEKDDSYAGGQDAVWIDGVTMPAGTQEIVVQQPEDTILTSGQSERSFPDTSIGDASKAKTFTIKNTGKADLAGIKVVTAGNNGGDFQIKDLGKQNLKKGESTTFKVVFAPKAFGQRNAKVRVISNDADESTFSIGVHGVGLGYPKMTILQPEDDKLKKGEKRDFGAAKVKTDGKTRKFTVTNTGSAVLKNLKLTVKGTNASDFKVGSFGVISLDPGDSTTVKVTFRPTGKDLRKATLVFKSNDARTGKFKIKVTGKGAPKGGKKGNNAIAAAARGSLAGALLGAESGDAATQAGAATGIEVIDGKKYLTLTLDKSADTPVGTVQVSSDLVEWFSGRKYTTVIVDDAKTLKVRDNTPITADSKRHIRVK